MSAFDREVIDFADGLGISLYQRFTLEEAALFLRLPIETVNQLIKTHAISYIQLTKTDVQFFGFQLIDYLLRQTKERQERGKAPATVPKSTNEQGLMRFPELKKLIGLSRTTVWRMERKGEFPQRVAITSSAVGWHRDQVQKWIDERN